MKKEVDLDNFVLLSFVLLFLVFILLNCTSAFAEPVGSYYIDGDTLTINGKPFEIILDSNGDKLLLINHQNDQQEILDLGEETNVEGVRIHFVTNKKTTDKYNPNNWYYEAFIDVEHSFLDVAVDWTITQNASTYDEEMKIKATMYNNGDEKITNAVFQFVIPAYVDATQTSGCQIEGNKIVANVPIDKYANKICSFTLVFKQGYVDQPLTASTVFSDAYNSQKVEFEPLTFFINTPITYEIDIENPRLMIPDTANVSILFSNSVLDEDAQVNATLLIPFYLSVDKSNKVIKQGISDKPGYTMYNVSFTLSENASTFWNLSLGSHWPSNEPAYFYFTQIVNKKKYVSAIEQLDMNASGHIIYETDPAKVPIDQAFTDFGINVSEDKYLEPYSIHEVIVRFKNRYNITFNNLFATLSVNNQTLATKRFNAEPYNENVIPDLSFTVPYITSATVFNFSLKLEFEYLNKSYIQTYSKGFNGIASPLITVTKKISHARAKEGDIVNITVIAKSPSIDKFSTFNFKEDLSNVTQFAQVLGLTQRTVSKIDNVEMEVYVYSLRITNISKTQTIQIPTLTTYTVGTVPVNTSTSVALQLESFTNQLRVGQNFEKTTAVIGEFIPIAFVFSNIGEDTIHNITFVPTYTSALQPTKIAPVIIPSLQKQEKVEYQIIFRVMEQLNTSEPLIEVTSQSNSGSLKNTSVLVTNKLTSSSSDVVGAFIRASAVQKSATVFDVTIENLGDASTKINLMTHNQTLLNETTSEPKSRQIVSLNTDLLKNDSLLDIYVQYSQIGQTVYAHIPIAEKFVAPTPRNQTPRNVTTRQNSTVLQTIPDNISINFEEESNGPNFTIIYYTILGLIALTGIVAIILIRVHKQKNATAPKMKTGYEPKPIEVPKLDLSKTVITNSVDSQLDINKKKLFELHQKMDEMKKRL